MIITYINSRIPIEKIFDLNLGDVLVIINAENKVSEDPLRSILISIFEINLKNVIVMHHTRCGCSIKNDESKIDYLIRTVPNSLMSKIRLSSNEDLIEWCGLFEKEEWNQNTRTNTKLLQEMLEEKLEPEHIPKFIPAIYNLDTGKVEFI